MRYLLHAFVVRVFGSCYSCKVISFSCGLGNMTTHGGLESTRDHSSTRQHFLSFLHLLILSLRFLLLAGAAVTVVVQSAHASVVSTFTSLML